MKKLMFLLMLATASLVSAQTTGDFSPTQKGNFVIESAVMSTATAPNTGLSYVDTNNGLKTFNVGLNAGYFVDTDLALKAGVGYGESRFNQVSSNQVWSFRVGGEYSYLGVIPIGIGWAGTSQNGADLSYFTSDIGFNWFVAKNVAVKPLVRYDISLKDADPNIFSVGVGLGYYF